MSKVIVFNAVSLDGFHTGVDNDASAIVPMLGGVFDEYTAERLRAAEVFLVGRESFQMFNHSGRRSPKVPTRTGGRTNRGK